MKRFKQILIVLVFGTTPLLSTNLYGSNLTSENTIQQEEKSKSKKKTKTTETKKDKEEQKKSKNRTRTYKPPKKDN
tara:strand:- start:39 stop:266 length:228 start_codon:yes stop_codon:yes gene_type:complete